MATLSKKILGRVTGTLGDITFRQRNGKNYLTSRPNSFKPTNDPATLARRAKFKFAVKLASMVNSIPELNLLWGANTANGSSGYNQLVSVNYAKLNPYSFTSKTQFTPDEGFGIKTSAITIGNDEITVSLLPIGTKEGIDVSHENSLQLFSILCLSEPVNEGDDKYRLFPLTSGILPLTLETEVIFSIQVSSAIEQLLSLYAKKQLLSGILTLDTEQNPVHWSSTFLV